MAAPEIAGSALTRAWSAYLLINKGVDGHGRLHEALEAFIRERCEAGAEDVEWLAVEGLKYLKTLDGSAAS